MSMPFYVAPEQIMKDRADCARKGIARGKALIAIQYSGGIAIVAENPSNTLRKSARSTTALRLQVSESTTNSIS